MTGQNRCELCERPLYGAAASAYLCPGCAQSTAERLGELAGMYERLEEMLLPAARCEYRSSRAIHSPVIVPMDVADARGSMATALGSWHRALYDALEWQAPPLIERQADRIAAAVKALLVNVPWIAGSWPAAGDFAREIRELHGDVSTVVRSKDRGTRMGNCPTQVDGVRCGAILRLPVGGSRIACPWCGASWEPEQWVELRLEQRKFESEPVASNPGVRVG